jgi:hypothetical protein
MLYAELLPPATNIFIHAKQRRDCLSIMIMAEITKANWLEKKCCTSSNLSMPDLVNTIMIEKFEKFSFNQEFPVFSNVCDFYDNFVIKFLETQT